MGLKSESKVVILNEEKEKVFLIDFLIEEQESKKLIKFSKLKMPQKSLNLFECPEVRTLFFFFKLN